MVFETISCSLHFTKSTALYPEGLSHLKCFEQFSTPPVTMHACKLLFSPPTGQRMKSADFYCDTEMGHIVLLAKILPFSFLV